MYAFAMIAYELFEGKKPFGNINPIEAARRASMDRVRPEWGKWGNQCVHCLCQPACSLGRTVMYGL